MVNTKNDKPIPSCTQDTFTTGCGKNIDNNSQDWNQNFNFGCSYLLPCGLCMKTDRPCPKYKSNTWEPFVTWRNLSGSASDSSLEDTININYTTGELKND